MHDRYPGTSFHASYFNLVTQNEQYTPTVVSQLNPPTKIFLQRTNTIPGIKQFVQLVQVLKCKKTQFCQDSVTTPMLQRDDY